MSGAVELLTKNYNKKKLNHEYENREVYCVVNSQSFGKKN